MTPDTPHPLLDKPVVLYDASCRFCTTTTDQLRALDRDGAIEWREMQDPAMRQRFPKIDWTRTEEEIHLIHQDGRVTTGARAISDIAALIGGDVGKAAAAAMNLPGVRDAADLVYHLVAENRHRLMPPEKKDPAS